jgi:ATP-dependent Clp protease ATP-binding subunit ClpB
LDEVEKAHSDVFNILLQVLDDGRLTDGQGRTVDFRNTVIVMTSNLGSEQIQQMGTKDYHQLKIEVMEIVGQYFRPEFINRVDDTVVFHSLAQDHIHQIAKIQLDILRQRIKSRDLQLSLSDAALKFISNSGFDPVYGARPLKRVIQQQLENPLAQEILSGTLHSGDHIWVDEKKGRLIFDKKVKNIAAA